MNNLKPGVSSTDKHFSGETREAQEEVHDLAIGTESGEDLLITCKVVVYDWEVEVVQVDNGTLLPEDLAYSLKLELEEIYHNYRIDTRRVTEMIGLTAQNAA